MGMARKRNVAGCGSEAPLIEGPPSPGLRHRRRATLEGEAPPHAVGMRSYALEMSNALAVLNNRRSRALVRRVGLRSRKRSTTAVRGGGTSRPSFPRAACSLALLTFLSDRSTAFQVAAPQTSHSTSDSRKHLRAETPCRKSSPLLQGSFTGGLGRQANNAPYIWGLGWPFPSASQTALGAAAPAGGDWGSSGGGGGVGTGGSVGGGMRGRGMGSVNGRSSVESPSTSMASRDAYAAFAQAPPAEVASSTAEAFPEIYEALSCYKRIHGHVKVSASARVPNNAPWPENLWGMELGKMVYKLRNEEELYETEYPDRMQLLHTLGFQWDHSASTDEWDLIIMAIESFYRINGHSRVPTRYECPSEEPWPMEIWGYRVGSRVAAMRQTGKFMGGDDETLERRRNQLDKLGFEWRLRVHDDHVASEGNEEEFAVLCEALQIYTDLGGSVPNMPPTFIIPNSDPWPIRTRGFPLGNQVRMIRSRQKYAKDSEEKADMLISLGVPISPTNMGGPTPYARGGPTEGRFDKLCKALEMFGYLYGHTEVPGNFEVPQEEPWPKWTWGVKLGMSLSNIATKGTFVKGYPDRQARLESLGFDTDPGGIRAHKEDLRRGMSAGDALAERQAALDFADEPATSFPPLAELEGDGEMNSQMLLGSVMESMRTRDADGVDSRRSVLDTETPATAVEKEQLEEEEDNRNLGEPRWNPEMKSQSTVNKNDQNDDVPTFMRREFTDEERATHTDQTDLRYWPEETQHQYVRKLIPQLGHLARGFDEVAVVEGAIGTEMVTLPGVLSPLEWDPQRTEKKEPDYGYGEKDEEDYLDEEDEEEVGMIDRQKGRRLIGGCSTAASGMDWCTEEDKKHILKVDYEWDEFGDGFRWDDVEAGLTLYKTLYGELPDDEFKVPVDYEWPVELSGMELGSFCKQMRIGDIWAKHDTQRRKVLDGLGFQWGNDDHYLDFQWPEVLIAFYSILRLKGHLDIDAHYVIPEEDPWPLPIRGTPAGFYLNIVRAQKDLLMEHYPDRYEVFRGMGVMWSEPILVDWTKEEERVEDPWREWGYRQESLDEEEIAVDPEFGLKE